MPMPNSVNNNEEADRAAEAVFYAHHGINRESHENRNRDYVARGYSLISEAHFGNCAGADSWQAIWMRR